MSGTNLGHHTLVETLGPLQGKHKVIKDGAIKSRLPLLESMELEMHKLQKNCRFFKRKFVRGSDQESPSFNYSLRTPPFKKSKPLPSWVEDVFLKEMKRKEGLETRRTLARTPLVVLDFSQLVSQTTTLNNPYMSTPHIAISRPKTSIEASPLKVDFQGIHIKERKQLP